VCSPPTLSWGVALRFNDTTKSIVKQKTAFVSKSVSRIEADWLANGVPRERKAMIGRTAISTWTNQIFPANSILEETARKTAPLPFRLTLLWRNLV